MDKPSLTFLTRSEGLSHEEEIFISDLISLNVFARDQGGYRKENRA